MHTMSASIEQAQVDLFAGYSCAGVYDEMFAAPGSARPHYETLHRQLAAMTLEGFRGQQQTADLAFLRQGVTFNVYRSDEGTERVFPFDLVPRIISKRKWERHRGRAEAAPPRAQLVRPRCVPPAAHPAPGVWCRWTWCSAAPASGPEFMGASVPHDIYVHVAGIDLVRDTDGRYLVLEDNLRCPSGVSYMLENRQVMKQVFPQLFERYDVRPIDDYPQKLRETLEYIAPGRAGDPLVVLLTPGVYNSAYFEHTFLARQMGVQLVQGHDLVVDGGAVHMRTTKGLRRVDVVYRRIDDDYLDPVSFRADSLLGVPGMIGAYRLGNVGLANGVGNGVADDKAIYRYVPEIIRYYLNEVPILDNVPTYLARDAGDRAYILAHLDQLVVKAVDQSGGYGMLIGPHATLGERAAFAERITSAPEQYIAQPTIALSRHPTFVQDRFEGRHIDLRPFVLYGKEISVIPGGLTRVALRPGSLVVNSSQGGGSKDTWVLAGEF